MHGADNILEGYTKDFFGFRVADVEMATLVHRIERRLLRKESTHVINLNPNVFLLALNNPEFGRICTSAEIVSADGIGIILASRLCDEPIRNRCTGQDLVVQLCSLAAQRQYSVFLLGGIHGAARKSAANLQKRFPRLRVAGVLEPPYAETIEQFDNARMVRAINEAAPDILFVGLGAPKQELWIERFRAELRVPIFLSIGATFDILGERFPRAPRWMQIVGLEWLFRLILEPRRLASRYVFGIPRFVVEVLKLSFHHDSRRESLRKSPP